MSRGLALSVTISGVGRLYGRNLLGLVELARMADDLGLDQLVMADHLAIGPRTDRYPYGRFPFAADEPWPEPLTTLAAMAAVTKHVRLGTGVLIAPLRPPLQLAKSVATLDVLSGGRLDLGVGVGWQPEEFCGSGSEFEARWARLDDTLRACRVLWRDSPASFSCERFHFEELWCEPRPQQEGGVPIWLGVAATERGVRRMVELGDGWMPLETDLEALGAAVGRIHQALLAAGRDPDAFGVRVAAPLVLDADRRPELEGTLEGLAALEAAGATVASFALAAFCRHRDEVRPFLERLASERGRLERSSEKAAP